MNEICSTIIIQFYQGSTDYFGHKNEINKISGKLITYLDYAGT
jgi:hypothetical protein